MINQPLAIADSNPDLCDIIARRIAATPQQRITFAEFMDLALYHPQHGYYSTRRSGIQRDFLTSPHLGNDFGELLAEQFVQMWEILDRPNPFTLVEMGAGQGLLVQDIVRYLHRQHFECFAALDYFIIEKSAALIAEQQQRLQPLTHSWSHLHWRTWADIPSNSIVGCCFSNELVDALPVHQIAIEAGQLREVYVAVGKEGGGGQRAEGRGQRDEGGGMETEGRGMEAEGRGQRAEGRGMEAEGGGRRAEGEAGSLFVEVMAAPSTSQLADYFNLIELPFPTDRYPDGYRSEVNLAALGWLDTVSDRLLRGYVLTIDYGYPAQRYYSPTRSQGTLQCYYQHSHHSDPYVAIGQQDITAHVDFTALERRGQHGGLQTLGFTQQGLFLMALGLGDRIAALSTPEPNQSLQDILQRRETLHALADPMGLGNFGVLVQAKNLSQSEQRQILKGFNIPPLF